MIVATGKYLRFIHELFDSVRTFFFPGHDVRIFLFTDQDVDDAECGDLAVEIIRITHEPWPWVTLKRYEYIDDNKHRFQDVDYLFWLDADSLFVSKVSEEILPEDASNGLVGVEHPSFRYAYKKATKIGELVDTERSSYRRGYRKIMKVSEKLREMEEKSRVPAFRIALHSVAMFPVRCSSLRSLLWRYYRMRGSYETNKKSTAYVAENEGDVYYTGAMWGGRVPEVLQLAQNLRHNVEEDLSWGHVAIWHDESHLNRYFIDHPPKVLSPSYSCHEGTTGPIEQKILRLSKDNKEIRDENRRV